MYFTNIQSLSISEGVTGVRILIVCNGDWVEFMTDGNKFKQVK